MNSLFPTHFHATFLPFYQVSLAIAYTSTFMGRTTYILWQSIMLSLTSQQDFVQHMVVWFMTNLLEHWTLDLQSFSLLLFSKMLKYKDLHSYFWDRNQYSMQSASAVMCCNLISWQITQITANVQSRIICAMHILTNASVGAFILSSLITSTLWLYALKIQRLEDWYQQWLLTPWPRHILTPHMLWKIVIETR